MKDRIIVIGLGCPKNQVDLEIMLKKLEDEGFELVDEINRARIAIINTCAFIDDAKTESIESILEMADYKADGTLKGIIVTGCMAERFRDEIFEDIPEVDAVLGIGANDDIVSACYAVSEGRKVKSYPDKDKLPLEGDRILTTPTHWAYLRISDGCSNHCTYCTIPSIRGEFRSRTKESVIAEAEKLVEGGAKELVLIAQDTTRYGEDIYGRLALPELLTQLCKIDALKMIRLLYCYPDRITDELLEVMAHEDKVMNYLDIPVQHADGGILKAMNRRGDKASLLALIEKIRATVPDVSLRTTLITGFPGEGEKEFETLSEFVKEAEFENLGCFAYSREEGTPAAELDGQVDNEVARHRSEIIMEQQFDIVSKNNEKYIGKTVDVLVDGYDRYTDSYYGHSYINAPDIDGRVMFTSGYTINDGEIVPVEIFGVAETGYDLIGEAV